MDVIIYHNPACGTSRNVLAMIRNSGVEPHIIEYLKCPPTRLLLTQLLDRAGLTVRQILREKGTPFHDLGLGDPSLSDDALLDAIGAHPILMNRPLVVTPKGVRLCRPSEAGSRFAAAATRTIHQGRRRARDRRSRTARRNGIGIPQCPCSNAISPCGSPCASSRALSSAISRQAYFMRSARRKSPRSTCRWRP